MIEGPDGALWIGGVRLLTRWQPHEPEWSLLPWLSAPQFVDGMERLWFTTETGAAFLAGSGPVERVDLAGPLARCRDGVLGRVGEGLGFWRDGQVHMIDPAALGLARISMWLVGASGEAWVAGFDAEGLDTIRRQVGDGWRPIAGLPPGFAVTDMALAAGDTMTAILRRGNEVVALLFRSEQIELLRLPAAPPTTPTHHVFLDGDDTWLIGSHRMRRLRADGTWALVEGLPGDTVSAAFRSAGQLWFACEGSLGGSAGLVRYDGRSVQPVELPGTRLIGVDRAHYLGDAGPTLTVFPDHASPHVVALPIAERAGRAVRDADGVIWIQTSRGCLRWSPDGVPPKTVASFSTAGIGERDLAVLAVDARRHNRPRHRNGSLQASYRIDDGAWSSFERVDARSIQLGSLPIGTHTVDVVVRDEAGVVDPYPVSIPIEVFPIPLQQRWWFWGIVALALGFLGLFAGVTNRSKALSRALQERLSAERRYRVVVENSPLGILEIDGAGKILSINKAGAAMLFVASGEAIGAALSDFVEPACRERIEKVVGRDGASFEFVTIHGRQIEATLRSLAEPGGSSARFALNLKDVTEARHLEASARHGQRMEAIGRLAGGVAHDFNNLLTAVLGNVELLRQHLTEAQPVNPAAHSLLGEVEMAGRRAAELTRQLLTFARRGQSAPVIVDVRSALRETQSLLGRIVSSEVQLYIEDDQAPATVRLGPGQLEQIVLNLVANAAEAMNNRGVVKIRLWRASLDLPDAARFGTLAAGSYVVIAVADHGAGIAPEVLQHLFEPFFTTKIAGKGTGLGLATVHGIVQVAGGRVDVSTQLGVGSEFVVWLPLVDDVPSVGTASAPAMVGGAETVLVCDDQPLVRTTVVNMLQGLGYKVLVAADADEALQIAGEHEGRIHLLLTDVTMPERTGPELASLFAERRRDTRVLFMTGYEATDFELPKSVLTKPFTIEQLAAHVRAALG
jgi:PAS domain S-box-containing protein